MEDRLRTCTAATPEFSMAGKVVTGKVVEAYDGDTCKIAMPLGDQIWKFTCRLAGYDCPEMKPAKTKANRDMEKARALKSKQALVSHICSDIPIHATYTNPELDTLIGKSTKLVQVTCKEFDKYGRLLVEIPTADGSALVNQWMVQQGYGYVYEGGTKDQTFATR